MFLSSYIKGIDRKYRTLMILPIMIRKLDVNNCAFLLLRIFLPLLTYGIANVKCIRTIVTLMNQNQTTFRYFQLCYNFVCADWNLTMISDVECSCVSLLAPTDV